MGEYESQIRAMMKQVGRIQGSQVAWKQKYYQLEGIVRYIDGVRANWRLERCCEEELAAAKMHSTDQTGLENSAITEHSSQYNPYEDLPAPFKTVKQPNLSS